VTRHATHRLWVFGVAVMAGSILTLVSANPIPLMLALPFGAALLLSWIDGWWPEVTVGAATADKPRVVEGDEVQFTFTVTAARRVSWFELEVQLSPNFGPITPTRFVGPISGTATFTVSARALHWGLGTPEWVVTTAKDRIAVTETVQRVPVSASVQIHPPTERLNNLIATAFDRPVTGDHRSKRLGPGSELAEVRPYRAGDPIRFVHPRLSQRRGQPMVVERHPEQSADLVLFVDSGQDLGLDLDTTLKLTVTAAKAITERHIRAHDRVGLLDSSWRLRWIPAKLGRRHLHLIVAALLATRVHPPDGGLEPVELPQHLPRRATIVAISPLLHIGLLRSLVALRTRGHHVVVLKPEVPIHESSYQREARRIFRLGLALNERWLRQAGVRIAPFTASDSIDNVIGRLLSHTGMQVIE